MKPVLTIDKLIQAARQFCEMESRENHVELIGVTDGKAVGTYVEHKFQHFLQSKYRVEVGSSAKGIDLPGSDIQTDIKVTSITQPQSSCPFKNARQKIFGLGYNLLFFVYDKQDTNYSCTLHFTHCTFIDKERTAVAMLLLNSEKVQGFLKSIAFLDVKRPYTKKVLERIDFNKIVKSLTIEELTEAEHKLNLSYYVTMPMYDAFKSLLSLGQIKFA